ncbi:hypothetical protein [Micromonospora sp. RTGN7]|uniref:hypothetical protein n=1 Tax=Micromonospora sp. RTGN7 TaxID=3016526 RepID=UPI0029FF0433|nr:hypothetical protein [Micromonospora sp. RTGN7]
MVSSGSNWIPRLELYPRDLDPVRALRLAQAGLVPPAVALDERRGLTPEQVTQRVRSRFPELDPLLAEAGLDLRWDRDRYVPPPPCNASSSVSVMQRRLSATTAPSRWTAESPELAAAMRAEARLAGARSAGGFRALTVRPRPGGTGPALRRPPDQHGRRLPAPPARLGRRRPEPALGDRPWHGRRATGTRGGDQARRARLATGHPELRTELRVSAGLVLLARYRAMDRLAELADAARQGGGTCRCSARWRTRRGCPSWTARWYGVGDTEWIALPDALVVEAHRSAFSTS